MPRNPPPAAGRRAGSWIVAASPCRLGALALLLAVLLHQVASGEVPSSDASGTSSDALHAILRRLVMDALPDEYEDTKKWGLTKEVFDRFVWRREGERWHLVRKTKTVNHGSWQRYRVRLLDPESRLTLEFGEVRAAPDGGMRFDVRATADAEIFARWSEWRYDVQLYSFNALAEARIELFAVCDVRLRLDPRRFPPDVVLEPRVAETRVSLIDFELLRLSQIHGAVAHELGKAMRRFLENALERRQEGLAAKMNKSLAKKDDRLRFRWEDHSPAFWSQVMTTNQPAEGHTSVPLPAATPETVPETGSQSRRDPGPILTAPRN